MLCAGLAHQKCTCTLYCTCIMLFSCCYRTDVGWSATLDNVLKDGTIYKLVYIDACDIRRGESHSFTRRELSVMSPIPDSSMESFVAIGDYDVINSTSNWDWDMIKSTYESKQLNDSSDRNLLASPDKKFPKISDVPNVEDDVKISSYTSCTYSDNIDSNDSPLSTNIVPVSGDLSSDVCVATSEGESVNSSSTSDDALSDREDDSSTTGPHTYTLRNSATKHEHTSNGCLDDLTESSTPVDNAQDMSSHASMSQSVVMPNVPDPVTQAEIKSIKKNNRDLVVKVNKMSGWLTEEKNKSSLLQKELLETKNEKDAVLIILNEQRKETAKIKEESVHKDKLIRALLAEKKTILGELEVNKELEKELKALKYSAQMKQSTVKQSTGSGEPSGSGAGVRAHSPKQRKASTERSRFAKVSSERELHEKLPLSGTAGGTRKSPTDLETKRKWLYDQSPSEQPKLDIATEHYKPARHLNGTNHVEHLAINLSDLEDGRPSKVDTHVGSNKPNRESKPGHFKSHMVPSVVEPKAYALPRNRYHLNPKELSPFESSDTPVKPVSPVKKCPVCDKDRPHGETSQAFNVHVESCLSMKGYR